MFAVQGYNVTCHVNMFLFTECTPIHDILRVRVNHNNYFSGSYIKTAEID